jgi:hypothetical protein
MIYYSKGLGSNSPEYGKYIYNNLEKHILMFSYDKENI